VEQRKPRPLTPLGAWVKTQSILKGIELRSVAKSIGIWPQNLTAKMRGERHFSDEEITKIEEIFEEKYFRSA
jgi:plasmid maintenance system antidote protein VapI